MGERLHDPDGTDAITLADRDGYPDEHTISDGIAARALAYVNDCAATVLDITRGTPSDRDADLDAAVARHPAGRGRVAPDPMGAPTRLDMTEELEGS